MKMNKVSKALSVILCLVLIAALALSVSGCNDKAANTSSGNEASAVSAVNSAANTDETVLGSGSKTITLTVVGVDKSEKNYKISTDKATLGEALVEVELVEGQGEGANFFVTTVNGVTLDYNKDGKYWAFYVGDSYATAGVMSTEITDGAAYALKAE